MFKLVLLFGSQTRTGEFDRRYGRSLEYLKAMPGVLRIDEGKVLGGPAGEAAYHHMVEIFFESFAAIDSALTSPEGVTAGKDLMDFTAGAVELLFVESVESAAAKPLTPEHLQAYLDEHGVQAKIILLDEPTPTVPAAAQALGVEVDRIVKSVLFLVGEKPFLVFGCGTRLVDFRKLAERLKVSRKRVKLADANQVLALTGYAVGTVPPVGLKTTIPAFMDPTIQQHDLIYAGGGGIKALLEMTPAELQRVSRAEVVPVLEDPSPAEPETPEA